MEVLACLVQLGYRLAAVACNFEVIVQEANYTSVRQGGVSAQHPADGLSVRSIRGLALYLKHGGHPHLITAMQILHVAANFSLTHRVL